MLRILTVFAALSIGTISQALTPEELRALVDKRVSGADPFQALLNDPDPTRSLAAVELMLESGEPQLVRMAVDFGLLSAIPEVRRTAVIGYLKTEPTLLLTLDSPESDDNFEAAYFRTKTGGTILSDGTAATFSVNIGMYSEELNCFLWLNSKSCVVKVGSTGISIRNGSLYRSDLFFNEDGTLSGVTTIEQLNGGFLTTLRLTE